MMRTLFLLGFVLLVVQGDVWGKDCVKGKPCGDACIPKEHDCHSNAPISDRPRTVNTSPIPNEPRKVMSKPEYKPNRYEPRQVDIPSFIPDEPKDCKDGKLCGDTCIPMNYDCHVDTPIFNNGPKVMSTPTFKPKTVTTSTFSESEPKMSSLERELGRLFMNAEERAKLNLLRSQPPMPTVEEQFNSFLPDPPHYITFKGAIVHEDGSTVVWISDGNGLYPPNTLYQPSFSIELDNTLKNRLLLLVTLPKGNKKRWLKLGQTLDTVDDKIIEESQNVN